MPSLNKQNKKLAALGGMTRGLIHDFNNSLASIMGYADFLASDLKEGSEPHQFALNIKAAGEQMQSLLHQIRALTLTLDEKTMTPLSVEQEVMRLCHDINGTLPPSHHLDVQINKIADAKINLHLSQFRILLINLIDNAFESLTTDGGNVTVHISSKKPKSRKWAKTKTIVECQTALMASAASNLIYITIDDTGSGIESSIFAKIFDPYFTTRTLRPAHGVGLTVVKSLVDQVDGGIFVETLLGQGTRIVLTLPTSSSKPH